MENELWKELYALVMGLSQRYRSPRVRHSNATIVLVLLWAVLHDRPLSWACREANWPAPALRPSSWPSPATLSRRLRRVPVLTFLAGLADALGPAGPEGLAKTLDGKPLPVGSHSKDRATRWGRAAKAWAKGYKVFALLSGGELETWRLGPMNQSEPATAPALLGAAWQRGWAGYVLADAQHDSNPLHAQVRGHGGQLLAPRKTPRAGWGHRPHDPGRCRSAELLEGPFGQGLYAQRADIERYLGQWGNFGGGLQPLPNWVRTPHRVALWVQGKLLIHALWRRRRHQAAAAA